MGKGSKFSEFTYGVGLEITAQSFKQVKDDLKLNLDNLSKMVKSYGKVLKIDPDADLSKLFDGMKQLQGIINGINSSNNSFSGFVDKGTLGSMAALETRLSDIDSTSDRVNAQLTELKGVISQLIEPLKAAGEIKFPATFENLFGNFEDQTAKIKSVSDSIATLRNSITELQKISSSASDIYSDMSAKGSKLDDKSIERLVSKFWDVRNQLSNISDLDPSKAKAAVAQIKDIGLQLASAIKGFSTDQLLDKFGIDDAIVVTEIDELIKTIQSKKDALATELSGLKDLQAKFVENQKAATPSKAASLGLQSDVTAQVKVTPKANDTEWANTINDTIKNVEPLLKPVRLTPTFAKSKNINKEIEGNLAQINHIVDVDFKVTDNAEAFRERIRALDKDIQWAHKMLSENGNFKIKFEYEESGSFRSVAYKIIDKLKHVEMHVDAQSTKQFLKELGSVRAAADKELKNIRGTIKFNKFDGLLKSVDNLKSGVDSKIGNIDINLHINNEPQIISQATLIRDKLVDLYGSIPINLTAGTIAPNTAVDTPSGEMRQLSDAAKDAQQKLEKCRQTLMSFNQHGFNAPEFLQLGDIGPDGKRIEGSGKKLEELLNKYKMLQAKLPDDLGARWSELYPDANGDINIARNLARQAQAELKQVESELNLYLQKQIAYTQTRYNQYDAIINKEKELASVKKDQENTTQTENTVVATNEKLATSAEEASKKVRSLNTILSNQRKVLEDLETNKLNSKSLITYGEWDKESGAFKKNKKEMQALVNEYRALREARQKAGETKVTGREAELRGKLGAILREQKKHMSEIIAQNQTELESAKAIVATYREADKRKGKSTGGQDTKDISTLAKNVDELTEKLNKANAALSNLKSNGLNAVGSTGIGDTKKVLKNAGVAQNLKETVALYNQLIAKKKEMEDGGGISQSISQINAQIDSLKNAKELLTSKGFLGLTDTKIGDVKGRLGGDPGALNTLISQYKHLLATKKEFEKSGDTTSDGYIQTSKALEGATQQLKILHQDQLKEIDARVQGLQTEASKRAEYVKIVQECKTIEDLLVEVHKNQVEYAQSRVQLYGEQLTQAQELLKVEQQRAQIAAQQPGAKPNVNQPASTTPSSETTPSADTEQTPGVVKLDSATLSSLAKDGTLKSIDGKVGNILSQLGNGINITGSNISIEASNVSVTGSNTKVAQNVNSEKPDKQVSTSASNPVVNQTNANQQLAASAENATNKQNALKAEIKQTQEQTEYMLSSTVNLVREVNGEIAASSDVYRTVDRVEEKTEKWGWVSHGKEEPPTFEHTSTVYKTNIEAYNKLYQSFVDSLAKQKQIEQQIASANGPTAKLQAELEIQKEITASLESQLQSHDKLYTQEAKRAAMIEATKKAQQGLAKITGAQSDKDVRKQNADLAKVVDSAQKKYNDMQYTMSNFKFPMADSAIAKFKEYEQLLTTLKTKQQEINLNPTLLQNENYSNNFVSLLQQMKSVESEFSVLQKASENFLSKIRSIEDIKTLGSTFDPNNLEQMHDEMYAFANQVGVGKAKLIEFNDAERTATFEIKNGKGQLQQLTVAYDSATNSLGRYTTKTKESVSETQKFISSLKHSFKNVARYLASFGSVYRIFAVIRQGFTYIKDIDSALTELKKVTDETDASYAKFLQDMSKTGKMVGATVKDLTTMAAEWARLGYSMQEAGKLAESTAVLLNVSEFEDATKASEALISTMQAFKYTADESGHVVDILNEIGNNYAVSSDGIATALQDSASALMEGGNNLEQAVALVAAANRVVQDPNSVGSALRTISLRLRGTSVKILEEMGEETEGVVESVSKLQKKIQALSGVNILTEAGDYKDTYTILREIGAVWEDMSDIDQAALLELMAGKNRANTLSAILSNMEDLENAYKDALDAEGSALKENEAYLDSIQGRVDLFNNSVQTMWMNMINSETVKGFVDAGTALINFIDKLELIPALLLTILSYKSMFSKNKWDFASMFGIHELDDNFRKGFSIFGNTGLTGWVAKKFKGKNNLANVVLGNPNDIKVSVSDFADAIQNNINDYVTIDTSRIDSEIQDVQNKLYVARQQLDTARKADWAYYKSLGSKTPAKDRDNRILEQRQQIKTLESDLAMLQARRDAMVSSAVSTTAQSMVGAINNETQAYKSMLVVLDQVRGKKLYIGNELDAATKIDAMSAAAKQGQTQLVNYVSTLGDADIALKAYAASVKDGKYSLAGFQAFVKQHNAELKASGAAAKVAAFGHQLLNAALSVGISLLISGAIRLISNLANAEKKAAEAAQEAADASKSFGEQADSLEDYKEQIKDLRKELDSNTLSESNAYDAREKLLIIQEELIKKFGLEKDGINLVTGAINDQIAAIDELSRKEAQQWLNSNQKEINNAIEYFDSDTKGGSLDNWYEGLNTRIDMWGQTQNVINMIDEYASQHDNISTNQGALIPGDQSISFHGSVEDVKAAVEDFQSWLETKENELLKQKTELLALPDQTDEIKSQITSIEKDIEQLQDVREDLGVEYKNWFGEGSTYASNKALIEETQRNTAITQYSDKYMKILQAENDLIEAQAKGDKDGIAAALETINTETAAAAEDAQANGQNYMVNFFNGIKDGYATQTKELNLELDLTNNASSKSSLLGILSLFKGKNAGEILQDYKIDPNTDAFQKLDAFAKQYDMTVEELIASLVNLNYIQSGFAAEVEDSGLAFKSYSELASDVESYNEILAQTHEIVSDNTKVTQEYKDSIIALGVSEEELNKYFDETDGLVVKNADGLNELIKNTRKTTAQNIKLAKSQARLEYYEKYKELKQLTNGQKITNAATLAQVKALYEEMTALQKSISRYSMLEHRLIGAANAYEKFAEAQEIDSANDYETKAEEMVGHLVDAFHTAKLGTESAQAAIKGLVPESVYSDLDTLDEKMQAVYDYFTTDLPKYFYIKFNEDGSLESAEMLIDNVKQFVTDGIEKYGVFTGSWEEWDLDPSIKSLDQLADKMNVTKEVAFAFLQAMETYDISWIGGDASTLMDKLLPSTDEIKAFGEEIKESFKNSGIDEDIDLTQRVKINREIMAGKGWDIGDDDYATTNTISAWASEFGLEGDDGSDYAINLTPILPDGTVIEGGEEVFKDWIRDQIAGGKDIYDLDIVLGKYADMDTAIQEAQKMHDLQEAYYAMVESYNLENDIYRNTQKQAEFEQQIATGQADLSNEETKAKYNALQDEADANAKAAREQITEWSNVTDVYNTAKDNVENLTSELKNLSETDPEYEAKVKELQGYEEEMLSAYEIMVKLGDPTEVILQFAKDDIVKELEEVESALKEKLEGKTYNLEDLVIFDSATEKYTVDYTLVPDDVSTSELERYVGLLNENYTIDALQGEGITTTLDVLNEIKDILQQTYELIVTTDIDDTAIDTWWEEFSAAPWYKKIYMVAEQLFGWGDDTDSSNSGVDAVSGATRVNGTAHSLGTAFKDGSWGAQKDETALVGELGPELLVRNGHWTTIGDNGAEFTQVKKGDIIFNHRQTEDLLSKGYVTGRGRLHGGAFAAGTAYEPGSVHPWTGGMNIGKDWTNIDTPIWNAATNGWYDSASALSDAANDLSDSADEFNEVFDWIEVRLEELEETLSLLSAQLENAVYYNEKNNIIDNMINVNKTKLANLEAGYEEYEDYAAALLTKVPEQYREAAKNGAIAIEKFVGEADEATLEAINNYREWIQKAADLKQQAEEIMTTIRDLAIQKFDNAYEAGDIRATVEDSQTEKLQNQVDLLETMGKIASDVYYGINGGNADNSTGMFENAYKKIEYLTEARKAMQAELNEAVEAGQIQRGSNEWYELIDQMYQIESQIHEANVELEEFQNAINDIYWDNFDQLINRLGYLKDETQNLIDLMDSDDMVVDPQKRRYEGGTVEYWTEDDVKWSDEGLASLGLYAQQMEIAEYTARQYAEAIDDLEKEYKAGHYSENEYVEKLNELKDAQYENIEAYYDAQEAIKDLNETRIDSIKEGIEKEIEAYEELIEKKKEELDAEKDLYDFQKDTMDQQKNIANIERQLAALANDNSMSAIARRKQLEAELAEAQYQLQDTYYNRSVEDKQTALDQELEKFQTEKDAEITKWEEYLTNVEQVVADSLLTIQSNATGIYDTLMGKAEEYDLTLTDSIMTPWQDGAFAVSDYQETFDTAMSSTMDQLEALKRKWQEIIDTMAQVGQAKVDAINKENASYAAATKKEPPKTQSKPAATTPSKPAQTQKTISVGGMINAAGAKIYGWPGGPGDGQYFSNDPIYTVLAENGEWIQVRHRGHSSGVTGWFKKSDVKPYAKGTTSLAKSGIVNIDELGDELLLRAQNGRLTYMEKGSGIVPADLTSNLMKWGELDPTNMLDQNRPAIGVHPEIHNTEVNISISYGDMVSIGEFHGDNPEDIAKIVAKQFEKHTKNLNNAIRKYSR